MIWTRIKRLWKNQGKDGVHKSWMAIKGINYAWYFALSEQGGKSRWTIIQYIPYTGFVSSSFLISSQFFLGEPKSWQNDLIEEENRRFYDSGLPNLKRWDSLLSLVTNWTLCYQKLNKWQPWLFVIYVKGSCSHKELEIVSNTSPVVLLLLLLVKSVFLTSYST